MDSKPPSGDSGTQASSIMLDTSSAHRFQVCWAHLDQVSRKENNTEVGCGMFFMGQI